MSCARYAKIAFFQKLLLLQLYVRILEHNNMNNMETTSGNLRETLRRGSQENENSLASHRSAFTTSYRGHPFLILAYTQLSFERHRGLLRIGY